MLWWYYYLLSQFEHEREHDEHHHKKPKPPHHKDRAHALVFTFSFGNGKHVKGEHMQSTFVVGQSEQVIGSPVKADGTPSTATLSSVSYTSSDPTIFTVGPDSAVPNGAIMSGLAAGTATLTETAIATEPDGTTTEKISGVATIIITAAPPPPPEPAAALTFTFGNPFPTPPAPPPVP